MTTKLALIALTSLCVVSSATAQKRAPTTDLGALQSRGADHFFAGRMKQAIADWDRVIKLDPKSGPRHWQRGLALYYAGEYEKGVTQFESHQTVNKHDVENAAWHFICVVRAPDGTVEKARKNFIPIEGDARVPMKQIHALFAGNGTQEEVLAAVKEGNPPTRELRNRSCYAHLYLALYYESLGEEKKAGKHIRKAAFDYKMDHYMGKVAQVHAKLRGIDELPGKKQNTPGKAQ